MKKFLIINNVPTPYRDFMFNKMYHTGKQYGIDVTVAFQARCERGRPWKPEDFSIPYPHYFSQKVLTNELHQNFSHFTINYDIIKDIASGKYQWVLLPPLMGTTNWIASFLPVKIKKILWSESNLDSTKHMDPFFRFIKSKAIKRFDALACPGERALEYLECLVPSIRSKPFLRLPNIVDTQKFLHEVREFKLQRSILREKMNIPKDVICLFGIGRFIEIKGYNSALDAMGSVQGKYLFCLAGDGPEKDEYKKIIKQNKLDNRVRLLGQISEDEVTQWLAISDWFFHPAKKDPSPLVVIEAVNAGLPMAVSKQTGNCPESVENNYNGFIFDAYNNQEIANTINKMITSSPEEREKMSLTSSQKAKKLFDPDVVLKEFYEELLKLS